MDTHTDHFKPLALQYAKTTGELMGTLSCLLICLKHEALPGLKDEHRLKSVLEEMARAQAVLNRLEEERV